MKIHCYLRFESQYGQTLFLSVNDDETMLPMAYVNDEFWDAVIEPPKSASVLTYRYHLLDRDGITRTEWGNDRTINLAGLNKVSAIQVIDCWNAGGAFENAFFTKPFRDIFLNRTVSGESRKTAPFTHIFKVKAPLLQANEAVCLLGHGIGLRGWDTAAPVLLHRQGNWWTTRLDLSSDDFPLGYKYGVWNSQTHKFQGFEEGNNRTLYTLQPAKNGLVILHDGFARFPNDTWHGAGVAIPVFGLRSDNSFGVGEFTDLHLLTDWARHTGLKLIQLLPVNDTSATGTSADSYPYASISAFALHPIYLHVEQIAGRKHAGLLKPFASKKKKLNALADVDYESVIQTKWEIFRLLFAVLKEEWAKDSAWLSWYETNRHWLEPYAAFCHLKEIYGTADFNRWPAHKTYTPDAVKNDDAAIHLFIQWHLNLQLQTATDYAHSRGLILKGDIPIGIYRYSCDAWVSPELYNMDQQAGAPPDDFAVKGQNWGFPTYNWTRMKQNGFEWWRQRFAQMNCYFDAFRIDHILGFFRIWSIPLDAVEGIMGHFMPALPVAEREFLDAMIGFNHDRLCKPYITDSVLHTIFGERAIYVRDHFLDQTPDAAVLSGSMQYSLKPAVYTQVKVAAFFESEAATDQNLRLRDGLFNLISNVLLFKDESARGYHFRYGIDKTTSFQALPEEIKGKINALYVDYFYRRQDSFWQHEAMEKLPALQRSTDMLICGEDLGMVPACVPDVMRELGILSLEIQRMPKKTGLTFFHPKDAPYLAVVTPSTHDMSTIRGWWEEDRRLSQRFFNEELGYPGTAPFYCEPWLNQAIVTQHLQSPAMWAIFQIQDLLGIDALLRRPDPAEERINIPADPKHYWRYRMHLSLEDLLKAEEFNKTLKEMVVMSGRV